MEKSGNYWQLVSEGFVAPSGIDSPLLAGVVCFLVLAGLVWSILNDQEPGDSPF